MGYRKVPRVYTLVFDGELEGLVVRAKSISFGKVQRLLSVMDSDDQDAQAIEEINAQLVANILSWNIEDEHGREVPVTKESIDDLDFADVIAIMNKWLGEITGPNEDLGKGSSSGGTFPGRPLTMEAL